MLRERRKETTRAALAASGVGEREFGLDERVSPRSEDGEFWETGGHPRRTGGVAEASATRSQLQRRRKARQAEDGRRFAPPEALGVHPKPLPSFEQTVGREGRGWFEVQEHKTNVPTPWEGGELSRGGAGAMRATASSTVAGAAGRRLDASTRRPIVADGLRREDDDHAIVADDPFKRRTIRHQDRPEVRRGRDAALPAPPSKVDHWQAFRESGGMAGSGPLDASARFTVQRWTTAVIEHRQAEERAFSNPGLDETGKQWRTDPDELKPLYSSFTADRRFRSASAGSFAAVGPAAREFAEHVAPQLRKQRLWSEAASRRERAVAARSRSRGASTSSAPLLPSLGGTVASSGLGFLG